MDTTGSSWESGKEMDTGSGGDCGGWRAIEIARTASVEAARREDEENNVFMELEVDVDKELMTRWRAALKDRMISSSSVTTAIRVPIFHLYPFRQGHPGL